MNRPVQSSCPLLVALGSLLFSAPATPSAESRDDNLILAAVQQGETLLKQGKAAEALREYEKALALAEKTWGRDGVKTAGVLQRLALVNAHLGRSPEAESLYRRVLLIQQSRLGKDHPDVAITLNNLGVLYQDTGRYAKAEPLFRQALAILRQRLGERHPTYAQGLHNLGRLYQAMGNYARAEPLLRQALAVRQQVLGEKHPDYAATLKTLAGLYMDMGQYARAEPLLQRCLHVYQQGLGGSHPHVAGVLAQLADLYQATGQLARVEPLLQQSLQILRAKLGEEHPQVADSLNKLATLYQGLGQPARAEPLIQRSLQIYERRLGKEHPRVSEAVSSLATLQASLGQWDQAAATIDRSLRLKHRLLQAVLPGLAGREQLVMLRLSHEPTLHVALSLGLRQRNDRGLAARSASWLLNNKALASQADTQRLQLVRGAANPQLAGLARELLAVRSRLAALTVKSPSSGNEAAARQQLEGLTSREQQLSRELGRRSGDQLDRPRWVESAAVQKALPPSAVLIDIARFPVFDFQARGQGRKWQAARYVAWVIPSAGQGPVQLIDLGPAGKIDEAVLAVRKAFLESPKALGGKNEVASEKKMRQPLEALAQRVLHPLAAHVGKAERWIVCPDATLWLVPWAALPLPDGKYAIEKHTISYLRSGREMLRPPVKGKAGPALIVADPDYDMKLGKAEAQEAADSPIPRVKRLRHTAREAREIAARLARYTGAAPAVYVGREAREKVLKAVRSPRILVLATHAFFIGDPRKTRGLENPLLRCGLLLAGANQRAQGDREEDGVLTGLEIVGSDLRHTELVVLRGSETGVGQVQAGEGVAGLQQAFLLAGARSVVATLGPIPEPETGRLMVAFFDHLAAGQGKAEALRLAQLDVIKHRRTMHRAAHPFYWAAFTLTGDWR
jgi:CHAT domain-containing protein/tetratricopeptide (TPR) repeat protein